MRCANEILRSEVERLRGVVAAPALLGSSGPWRDGGAWGADAAWVDGSGTGNVYSQSQSQSSADLDMVVWDASPGISEVIEGEVGSWGEYLLFDHGDVHNVLIPNQRRLLDWGLGIPIRWIHSAG